MRYLIHFVASLSVCCFIYLPATAQDKVVVVPLSSSAKGTNGQFQYNDNGATAGAEVYYDKTTGKMELPGELRTVDGVGNNRLWGKGRPGTGLLTHADPNGFCTTSAGVKLALSSNLETWGSADHVCPSGTWVCSNADLPTDGSCPIEPLVTIDTVQCDGTHASSPSLLSALYGWTSDDRGGISGSIRYSSNWNLYLGGDKCGMARAFCCWK